MRHRFHALCPYFAMFPETFAEKWIEELTKPDDLVLDPFCGRGTTGLSALLLERRAISSDVNNVAYCVTRAKTSPPTLATLRRRIHQLEAGYSSKYWKSKARQMPAFFHAAYAVSTLAQLLYLRSVLRWQKSSTDAMVGALVLGSLHGETKTSTAYFSNQMPRTISTKPTYSIKYWNKHRMFPPERDAFELLLARAKFRYQSGRPSGVALTLQSDIRDLPRKKHRFQGPIKCVITSPPYLDVTDFQEDQWLRLWFLGGPTAPRTGGRTNDDRHRSTDTYWRFICDTWRSLGAIVARNSNVVIRLGSRRTEPDELITLLNASTRVAGRRVELVSCEVTELRKRQTDNFRPGSKGCAFEVDCHFHLPG